MSLIPSQEQNPNGLHQRYLITKADGTAIDPDAIYFVFRVDSGGKDPKWIAACRDALANLAYTLGLMGHLPRIVRDIKALLQTLDEMDVVNAADGWGKEE